MVNQKNKRDGLLLEKKRCGISGLLGAHRKLKLERRFYLFLMGDKNKKAGSLIRCVYTQGCERLACGRWLSTLN